MHDYILIQSTQLFCKAVASYPSRVFWVSRYPLLHLHSPLRHPRHSTAMVTPIKTLDRDDSLRTQKTELCSQGTHLPLECTSHPPTLSNSD